MIIKKYCVTVKRENVDKITISKKFILCNLTEAHKTFKDKFSEMKVRFSKFTELFPKYCILAGQNETHSMCVYTMNQNIKLMIENAKLDMLIKRELASYKHYLAKIICNPASTDCWVRNCTALLRK